MEFEIDDVRDAFTHGGVKGAALEAGVVETVLRPYLPEKIGICTGQTIDASGERSKQLDVVLFDRANTPTLKRSGEIRLIPAECVFAIIEVKGVIKSSADIGRVFENMRSARGLSRSAITPDPRLHFVQIEHYGHNVSAFPIHYSCFAFESKLSAGKMESVLEQQVSIRGLSATNCVDMLLTLKPPALWLMDDGQLVRFKRAVKGREMAEYYLRLHQHLSRAMMSGFLDLDKYLPG
ncbi:MAG: DUF6602 domain-containing protein [Bryobacteraceae bacterium]